MKMTIHKDPRRITAGLGAWLSEVNVLSMPSAVRKHGNPSKRSKRLKLRRKMSRRRS